MKSYSTWLAWLIFDFGGRCACGLRPHHSPTPANPAPAPDQTGATPSTAEPASEATPMPGASESASADALIGTPWQMTAIVGNDGAMLPAVPDAAATAMFQNSEFGGNDGCNDLFGTYSLDGASLSITVTGGTLMACQSEAINEQGRLYLDNLGHVAGYNIQDSTLTLTGADGATLITFQAEQSEANLPLAGTTWRLTAYSSSQGIMASALQGTEVTAMFDQSGALTGSAGCNRYSAPYSIDGNNITFHPAISTKMACAIPQGIMQQESGYLALLSQVAGYSIEGHVLSLFDAGENVVATFTAAPSGGESDSPSATPTATGVSTQEALVGVLWQWTGTQFEDGTGLGIKAPQRYTVEFASGGALAILADCNQGSGTYTLSGDNIQIELGAFTLMACGSNSMDQIFLAQLAAAQNFVVTIGELSIKLSNSGGTMNFVAAS